ncbi:MAG TPA: DUF5677 domain-containing protein [Rhizorhapis sp.]
MTTQVPSDNVRAGLAKIRGALDWIDSKLPGVKIDGDHRHRIPAQLYDLALEHAASILHLIDTCRYASAFALVRCEFECFVRGAWIHHRATDEEIEQFVEKDEIKPKIWQLIEALEQHPPFEDKLLSNVKEKAWTPMNGYTHGGIHQVSRRLVGDFIEPAFEDESLLEVIQFAGIMGLIAFGEIAAMAEREDLVAEAQAMMDSGAVQVLHA